MKMRKWLAVLLTIAVVLSATSFLDVIGYAAEMEKTEAQNTEGDEAEETHETPEASVTPEISVTPETSVMPETSAVPEASATPEDSSAPETEKEAEKPAAKSASKKDGKKTKKSVLSKLKKALGIEEEKSDEESAESDIAPASLLPLTEKNAILVLNDIPDEDLKKVPVSTMLERLCDPDGKPIEIASDANAVWTYFKDEDGNRLSEEYHKVSPTETIDMTPPWKGSLNYEMELIIGKGTQLDPDGIRYKVTVYVTSKIQEEIGCELYVDGTYGRSRVITDREKQLNSSVLGLDVISMFNMIKSHQPGQKYFLNLTSSAAKVYPNINVDVYTLAEYMKYNLTKEGNPITGQILNQKNMYESGGYQGTFDAPENAYSGSDNIFVFVYKDAATGVQVASKAVAVIVVNDIAYVSGAAYTYENGGMKEIAEYIHEYQDVQDLTVDLQSGEVSSGDYVENFSIMLKPEYEADAENYFAFSAHSNIWTDDANGHVVKAVRGLFDTLEAAEGEPDIKDQVIPVDRTGAPYGYKANYNDQVSFTIFFDDDTVFKFRVYMYNSSEHFRDYDPAPIVGDRDPWFNVTGVIQGDQMLDSYVIENDYAQTLDTLYGYGYQTLLINEKNVDLSQLKPVFYLAGDGKRVEAYVGTKQESGVSVQDFSKGSVQYTGLIDGNEKNYQVTMVKKASGPKLFVNGPAKREVFLDEYFEYRHDILIANVGDAPLTGLKAELIDARNVKLDDYWTVGGENNSTLAAFTSTDKYQTEKGELSNLAKIRLLPEGDGNISGTLRISADGQDPVDIQLTGRASNPSIVTESLDTATKYVPYSYLVATNNMHDWNKVDFSLEKGKLPKGMKLYESSGEIYGVPRETGKFKIRVKATYSRKEFEPSYADLTLTVRNNTNTNVYGTSDEGYTLLDSIGEDTGGNRDFYLANYSSDQLFVSSGEFSDFVDLWLNGKKLTEGEDYTKEEGSTRITVRSQTFANKAVKDSANTIAAEFRVGGDSSGELRRTAQNFRLNKTGGSSSKSKSKSGTNSGNSASSSSSGSSSGGSSSSGTSAASETTGSRSVTCTVKMVDADNKIIANLPLELHSTAQKMSTNASGFAPFADIEFGDHTLYVNDEDGSSLCSKEFEIKSGDELSLSGDTITARNGSSFILTAQYADSEIKLLSVKETTGRTTPSTGDSAEVGRWIVLMLLSMGIMIIFYGRQRLQDRG